MYEGNELHHIFPNWSSIREFREEVEASIIKDISLGRKSGPFLEPPCTPFVGSPMGAFRKKRSNKVRVIHDLSFPHDNSVNAGIKPEHCNVSFISIDNAVAEVKRRKRGCLMSKLDIADAYKTIPVRPQDWHMLGSTYDTSHGQKLYFIDHVLPFGLRTSAKIFDEFASGLEYFMLMEGATNAIHYLDDFWTCGEKHTEECLNNLKFMLNVCSDCGMAVNPKKVELPTTTIEFLGIIIDSEAMELRMSEERLSDIKSELAAWQGKRSGTKRELLSLLGKLIFTTRVIRPGTIFTRRLFHAVNKLKHLHHQVKLNSETLKDIAWWANIAHKWNRKCLFLDEKWISSIDINLQTDASNIACAGVLNNLWFVKTLDLQEKSKDISWRELYAVTLACAVWGHRFTSKRVMIHCDNLGVVHSVNKGYSKCKDMMVLIRALYDTAVTFNFDCRLIHVYGIDNSAADALSRCQMKRFFDGLPSASRSATPIPATLSQRIKTCPM